MALTPVFIPYPVKTQSNQNVKTNQKVKAKDEKYGIESTEQQHCSLPEPNPRPYPVVFKKKLDLDAKEMKSMNQLTIIESEKIESTEDKKKKKKKRNTLKRRIATGAAVTGATALTACVFFPAAPFVLLGAGGVAGAQEYKIHQKKKRLEKEKENEKEKEKEQEEEKNETKEPELRHKTTNEILLDLFEEDEKIEQLRKTSRNSTPTQSEFFVTNSDFTTNISSSHNCVQKHLSKAFADTSDDFEIFSRKSLGDADLENALDLRDSIDENKYQSLPTKENGNFVEEDEEETQDSSSHNINKKEIKKRNKNYLSQAYESLMSKQNIFQNESSKSEIIPKLKYKCTKGHEMKQIIVKDQGFTCNLCATVQTKSDIVYGCRECDYDLCETCLKSVTIIKEPKKEIQTENTSDPELYIKSIFLSSDEESDSQIDEEYFH